MPATAMVAYLSGTEAGVPNEMGQHWKVDFLLESSGRRAMPATLSSSYAAPVSLLCPTCGKKMEQTSATPTSGGVIYAFLCSSDGDRLSWQRGHPNNSPIARDEEQNHPTTI